MNALQRAAVLLVAGLAVLSGGAQAQTPIDDPDAIDPLIPQALTPYLDGGGELPDEPITPTLEPGSPFEVCTGGAYVATPGEGPSEGPSASNCLPGEGKAEGGTAPGGPQLGDDPYCTNYPQDIKRCPLTTRNLPFLCFYRPKNTYRSPGAGQAGPYTIKSVVVNECIGRGIILQEFNGCIEKLRRYGWSPVFCDTQSAAGAGKKVFRLTDACRESGTYRVWGTGIVHHAGEGPNPLRVRGAGPRSSYIRC